jgi:hypothetical protein
LRSEGFEAFDLIEGEMREDVRVEIERVVME